MSYARNLIRPVIPIATSYEKKRVPRPSREENGKHTMKVEDIKKEEGEWQAIPVKSARKVTPCHPSNKWHTVLVRIFTHLSQQHTGVRRLHTSAPTHIHLKLHSINSSPLICFISYIWKILPHPLLMMSFKSTAPRFCNTFMSPTQALRSDLLLFYSSWWPNSAHKLWFLQWFRSLSGSSRLWASMYNMNP